MRESMRRLAFDDGEEKAVRGVRRVRVELLDGDHITIEVHRKARGEDLLDRICEDLDVAEKDYFGLLHLQRGDPRVWVDLNKRLSKTFRNEPWEVMFAVKFYPPEPTALEDEVSRYQIGLAVKKDIAEGRLPCSPITLALLSSYELQAAAGDHGAGCQCGALLAAAPPPPAPLARSALQDNVHALYLKHRGMSPVEAELQYLASAARLPLYGAHTHAARDVTLALSAAGLALCNEGVVLSRFPWPKIIKMSYNKRSFTLKLRASEFDEFETDVSFKLPSTRACKKLWKCSVEHHIFFRREAPVSVPGRHGAWGSPSCRRTLRQLRARPPHLTS